MMKNDGSANIQKTATARHKMSRSPVKNGRLHYCFSPILFLLLLQVALQLKVGLLHSFCHCLYSIGTTVSSMVDFDDFESM
jgi:hypothetical protein